ncbi:MAG: Glutathione S-transferase domain protein [Solirubrobacterales bacterium]|nr:Glutathione S-transferase domain protein [Solirubrobacterales bacterium]
MHAPAEARPVSATGSVPAGATLYVFPGSHACRSGMLMLDHKGISYRRVDLVPGLHPLSVRLRGFPGSGTPIRSVDGRTHRSLAILDRVGTVPALRLGGERAQTNHDIARLLERVQPDPPLFPIDEHLRHEVEAAERWGDQALQMIARRLVLAASLRGLDTIPGRGSRGRLGPLLSENERIRVVASRVAGRIFAVTPARERDLLEELPATLDTVDEWISAGVLDGKELNAADLMIAPSLALLAYRPDLRPDIEARPAGALLERVLPEPSPGP